MNFFNKFNKLKTKNFKTNITKILSITTFGLLFIIMGSSYAYLTTSEKGTLINTISSGNLGLSLDNEISTLSLNKAVPQLNDDALENNSEYTFTLSNTGDVLTHYEIFLNNVCTTNEAYLVDNQNITPDLCVDEKYINIGVKEGDNDYTILNFEENKVTLDIGEIWPEEQKNYIVKIWLDKDTPNEYNAYYNEEERNILFVSKISVTGEQRKYREQENASNTINATKKEAETTVLSGNWSDEGLNYTLKAENTTSSDYQIYYCKDETNVCTPDTLTTSETSITSYNTLEGIYYIRYKIETEEDTSSNIESYEAKVDTTKPTLPVIYNSSDEKWTDADVVVIKPSSTDTGSGICKFEYRYDDNYDADDWKNWTSGKETLESGAVQVYGEWKSQQDKTIYIRAVDCAGNVSDVATTKVKIDRTIPTVSITATKKTSETTVLSENWSDEGLNFKLTTGTTGKSGGTIYYCKDETNTCTPSTSVSSGASITSYNGVTGTYYIRYKIVSGSEKSSSVKSYTAQVDTTSPTVSITATKSSAATTVASDSWSDEGLNFKITALTTGKSGYTLYYCKDTANTCTPKTSVSSGTSITKYKGTTGTYYIRYKIVSGAGKSSGIGSYTAKVDTTSPTVSIKATKSSAATTVSSDAWSNEGLNFKITALTTGSSGYTLYYCKDTANTCTPKTSVSSGTSITSYNGTTGTYYIRYKIVTVAGKSSGVGSYVAKVDTTKPTTPTIGNSSDQKWTNAEKVTLTPSSKDTESGICKFQYRYDNDYDDTDGWVTWYKSLEEISSGTYQVTGNWSSQQNNTLYIRAVDCAGNKSSVTTTKVKIDRTKPTTPVITNSSGGSCTTKATITATSTDTASGVAKFQYSYDASTWYEDWNDDTYTSIENGLQVQDDWKYPRTETLYIRAIDNAGNISATSSTPINVKYSCSSSSSSGSSSSGGTSSGGTTSCTYTCPSGYQKFGTSCFRLYSGEAICQQKCGTWASTGKESGSCYCTDTSISATCK